MNFCSEIRKKITLCIIRFDFIEFVPTKFKRNIKFVKTFYPDDIERKQVHFIFQKREFA